MLVLFSFLLLGCTSPSGDFLQPVPTPAAWSVLSDGHLQPNQWWRSFNDPALNTLVEVALIDNFTLRSAWDRLNQSRAIAKRAGADLYPSVDLDAGVSRSRSRNNNSDTISYDTDIRLELQASYELDLWGRVSSTRDAARLDAQVSEDDLLTAAITLSSDVALRWYEYAEQIERIAVLQEQINSNESVLEVLRAQFRAGQNRAEDVLRQKNLIESNRGELTVAQQRAETLRLQLLVLLGLPTDSTLPVSQPPTVVSLPGLPGLGLPSEIIQQRPDVRGAYRLVQAADRRVAAAIADRYPAISLSASVGTNAGSASDLFNNWIGTIAGNLVQPIIDGEQRQAEVDRTEAVTSEAINNYGQTVLIALQEVETALSQERQQRLFVQSLDQQYETAQSVIELVRNSYLSGQSAYIDVLDAQTTAQSLELERLEARRELLGFRIDLSRALAGGWELHAPAPATFIEATIPDERKAK